MGNCIGSSIEVPLTQIFTSSSRVPPEKKKALLIGLNYTGTSAELKGCINDAKNFKKLLMLKYKFDKVKVLTDRELSRGNNVLEQLEKFLSDPVETMIFHYSGHGTQTTDRDGDEEDGKDEVLYTKYGVMASDDEINKLISRVPKGSKVVIITDACHSGSIVDLPWQMKGDGKISKVSDKEVQADVICISGCRDNQVSMDIQSGPMSYGALSNSLSVILKRSRNDTTTWVELVTELRKYMRGKRYAQVPQLSVSRKGLFDEVMNL